VGIPTASPLVPEFAAQIGRTAYCLAPSLRWIWNWLVTEYLGQGGLWKNAAGYTRAHPVEILVVRYRSRVREDQV